MLLISVITNDSTKEHIEKNKSAYRELGWGWGGGGGEVRLRDLADALLNPSGQGQKLKWEWIYLAS